MPSASLDDPELGTFVAKSVLSCDKNNMKITHSIYAILCSLEEGWNVNIRNDSRVEASIFISSPGMASTPGSPFALGLCVSNRCFLALFLLLLSLAPEIYLFFGYYLCSPFHCHIPYPFLFHDACLLMPATALWS